jgi:hypothetical protein
MRAGILAVAIGIIGCGDDDSGSGQYVSVADFEASYKDAECTYMTNCGIFPDKATCLAANLLSGTAYSLSADLRAAIAAGRVSYNGNAVFECFNAIANASCDKTDEAGRIPMLSCFTFTRGTLGADAPCQIDADCISQNCRVTVADEQCATGTCVGDTAPEIRIPADGENCNSVIGCARGSYCDMTSFECTPLKAAGADCTDGRECGYGLGCAGAPRVCKTLPGLNESCPDAICRDDGQRCSASTCKPLGLPGTTCQSSADCSPYFPCDFSTTMCKKPAGLGEACTAANSRCFDEHTYCDSTTLRCVASKEDGATCETDAQCQSDECDFTTSTCVAPFSCSG